jgi:hypothetical protein
MRRKILYIIIFAVLISVLLQLLVFNGFDKEVFEALNINFLAGVIGVVLTYLIIDRLLEKYEERRKTTFINESIANEYKSLLSKISQYYITYVTKCPPQTTKDQDSFEKVISNLINNLDKHVDGDFLRKNITVIQPKLKNGWIEPEEKKYEYQDFCELTKQNIRKSIDDFFIKYNSLIPEEVIVNLSNINNCFMQPIFTTGLEYGIRIDISNAQFNPEDYKKSINEIGHYIVKLYEYSS